MKEKDLTTAQLHAALKARGFTPGVFGNYWQLPNSGVNVCINNFSSNHNPNRWKLACMIQEDQKHEKLKNQEDALRAVLLPLSRLEKAAKLHLESNHGCGPYAWNGAHGGIQNFADSIPQPDLAEALCALLDAPLPAPWQMMSSQTHSDYQTIRRYALAALEGHR